MSKKSKKKTVAVAVKLVPTRPKKKRSRKKRGGKSAIPGGLTPAGVGFLKTAMSPCDFRHGSSGFEGIPDEFDGNIVIDENVSTTSLISATFTVGNDVYIIQPPIPGVAYMYGQCAAGVTGITSIAFTPVWYSDVATLFPSAGDTSRVVDKFRVASNAIEVVNTTNEMTWAGSVEAYKLNLAMGITADSFVDAGAITGYLDVPFITGLDGLLTSEVGYVASMRDGVFMAAFNQQSSYPFVPVRCNSALTGQSTDQTLGGASQGHSTTFNNVAPNIFVGLGTLETNVIRFPAIAASQSVRIRAWSSIEYTVPTTSVLYNYSRLSPSMDLPALEYMKALHHQLPIAVRACDNASFWDNVRKWILRFSKAGSLVPGAIGAVSSIVHSAVKSGDIGFSLDE